MAAALADNLPRLPDGSYRVHLLDGVDDVELGHVYRSGRRWQALAPDRRVVGHRAATRTEAVDRLLAAPGPLFGDPAACWMRGIGSPPTASSRPPMPCARTRNRAS